jgi:hypothetical protein
MATIEETDPKLYGEEQLEERSPYSNVCLKPCIIGSASQNTRPFSGYIGNEIQEAKQGTK